MNSISGKVSRGDSSKDSLWFLLGLRSSLGFRLIILFILPGALSPLFIDRAENGGSVLLWLGLVLFSHLGFSLTILLARKLIHGNRSNESHPAATLFAFFAAQSVRGSILGISTVLLGFTDDPKLAFRIISGGAFISTVLSVIAISIAIYDQHSTLVRNLETKSSELLQLRSSLDIRIQQTARNLRQYAAQVVTPRIDQIDQQLVALKSGGDKVRAVQQMQEYIETELRPFSHQIAHDKSLTAIEVNTEQPTKNFQLPRTINLSKSMRPYTTTLLFFITYAAAAQRTMTLIESVPFLLVTTVLLFIFFTGFKTLFRNRELPIAIGLVFGAAIFGAVGPLILLIESFFPINVPQHISSATVFVGLIYGFANLGYTILTSQRNRMISELTSTIENLESTVSLLNQKEWISRRQVGYVMHGSLQSALNAAVLQLGSTSAPSLELIESVRSEIAAALARVGFESGQNYSFEQARQEISKIWSGTMEINWVIEPEATRALLSNSATSECLAEVLREAVSNASKHGKATGVEIAVNIEDSTIVLIVEDNGAPIGTGNTQGLGSELFDDVCAKWELVRTDSGGMKLSATLILEHGDFS